MRFRWRHKGGGMFELEAAPTLPIHERYVLAGRIVRVENPRPLKPQWLAFQIINGQPIRIPPLFGSKGDARYVVEDIILEREARKSEKNFPELLIRALRDDLAERLHTPEPDDAAWILDRLNQILRQISRPSP